MVGIVNFSTKPQQQQKDGESVEAIINKLKLNASAISDSDDENEGSLSSRSRNSGRGEPIEEKLIQKGKEMEDKKEQLRDRYFSEVCVLLLILLIIDIFSE